MTSDHRYIISIIDQTTFLEKLWTKLEKKHFVRALVLIRSKIEKKTFLQGFGKKSGKNTLSGMALVKIRAKIEKNALCGRSLVRVRAKIEKKTPFLVGL